MGANSVYRRILAKMEIAKQQQLMTVHLTHEPILTLEEGEYLVGRIRYAEAALRGESVG